MPLPEAHRVAIVDRAERLPICQREDLLPDGSRWASPPALLRLRRSAGRGTQRMPARPRRPREPGKPPGGDRPRRAPPPRLHGQWGQECNAHGPRGRCRTDDQCHHPQRQRRMAIRVAMRLRKYRRSSHGPTEPAAGGRAAPPATHSGRNRNAKQNRPGSTRPVLILIEARGLTRRTPAACGRAGPAAAGRSSCASG